ncbi:MULTISPECIES: FadR/GntR family transcriptional regulator [Ensifer]|uniref:FCD domain-containing protein n=1 Tax=Ensifer canadensis TaxID=555315 RepID=A0AAW4FEH7_9HYPH|nr:MULTISPECIES: FadR/GntR family transcriptional regulator [Ensifer]MDP9634520.1 DNA-binding FadR family transcriptional regulator [Ensifer adhaerens]KQU84183.1 GntR family transcriptional regulator [Ensifer sp. Root31]KQW60800.1 GntR family transcriptional regulator [Ensifer sp. Root1252]KQW75343.1 GntR family transcriptional regulator [Ensifer sp. Root127]KQY66889.1 GntR family transcriptional regulator [Ensifer sp. Root142]
MNRSLLETVLSGTRKRTSHAHVVDQLGKAIVSGEFPIGSILPGDPELAARFKVSRTVLREAMKTLAAKGLVVPRARIGTRVTPRNDWNLFDNDILTWHFECGVDEEFLYHLSEVRLAFEPHAAALAARNASEAEISRMMRLAVAMGEAGHTAESLAFADLKFHLSIAEASGNPFMRTVGGLIEAALVGIFKLSSPVEEKGGVDEVARNHIRIVEEIGRRDEAGARAAMENVIKIGRERVRGALRSGEN